MKIQKHFEFVGRDGSGVPRCFGRGPTPYTAVIECRKAIVEYVRQRPDTGPVGDWTLAKTTN